MHNDAALSQGPLVGKNFSFSEKKVHAEIKTIALEFDVTCITEKQKSAMSKALFDKGIINATEHAILSLPKRNIRATLAHTDVSQELLNLIEIYQEKVAISSGYTNLSATKAIDSKFLFIMQDLHQQHIH
jgi:hypothetical protein